MVKSLNIPEDRNNSGLEEDQWLLFPLLVTETANSKGHKKRILKVEVCLLHDTIGISEEG